MLAGVSLRVSVLVRCVAALAGVTATVLPIRAEQHWISLTTPYFEMYTTNGASSGTRTLQVFERVRAFFLEASPTKQVPDTPVRIIAFHSEKEFAPYRPNGGASAYYQRSRKRDYIVMQDLSTDNYRTAVHEYTHLIVEHAGMQLPVWLNEGLADLYSSLEPRGDQTIVGQPLQSHLQLLAQQKWLDLSLLTSVQQDSPYYNERDKMAIFYAQSWALTHMLALGKDYHAGFPRFLSAICSGNSTETSIAKVYGKTLRQVRTDLNGYFQKATIQVSVFDIKMEKVNLQPRVADLTPLHTELALTDLLASQPRKGPEAKSRLERIAATYPENAEVEESLGYFAWQSGDPRGAAAHFATAVAKGVDNPEMLYHYATLIGGEHENLQLSIAALRKALELKPEYREAKYFLGMQEVNAGHYGIARSVLTSLKTVKPTEAFAVYSALAYCDLRLNIPDQARVLGQRAKEYAGTDAERQHADEFLDYLDRLEKSKNTAAQPQALHAETRFQPPAFGQAARQAPVMLDHQELGRVTGTAEALECRGTVLHLRVRVDGKLIVFVIGDPKTIIVRNTKDGYIDLACGPMKPAPITVLFAPDPAGATDGLVRELQF
jgi:tetratricopeptide (TPR) repeat protein